MNFVSAKSFCGRNYAFKLMAQYSYADHILFYFIFTTDPKCLKIQIFIALSKRI